MESCGAHAIIPQSVTPRCADVTEPRPHGKVGAGWHHSVFRQCVCVSVAERRTRLEENFGTGDTDWRRAAHLGVGEHLVRIVEFCSCLLFFYFKIYFCEDIEKVSSLVFVFVFFSVFVFVFVGFRKRVLKLVFGFSGGQ